MPGYVDPGAIGMNIFNAFRQGQQEAQQQRGQNALAQYAANPTPESLNALAQYDPQFVMHTKQQQAQAQQAQQQQQRNDLPVIGRLLDHAVDGQTYQQALAQAQRLGIDVSQAPPAWEQGGQQFVMDTKALVQAIQTPQGQEALSTAGKQAVDMGFKPGTPEFTQAVHDIFVAGAAKPYTGSQGETRLYVPQIGGTGQSMGGPQPGSVEDGYRFKGGNPADPNAWEPVAGGGGDNVTSGFHPVGMAGERVTSTLRSAAHNKAVGGVANSYHLRGLARDSVPPPGMSMGAYASELQRLNPHLQVINEGDHVHMEPRG